MNWYDSDGGEGQSQELHLAPIKIPGSLYS